MKTIPHEPLLLSFVRSFVRSPLSSSPPLLLLGAVGCRGFALDVGLQCKNNDCWFDVGVQRRRTETDRFVVHRE